jgi:hypothetical protein
MLAPGGGRWKLNLVDGRPEHARINREDLILRPELVRDPDEVERLLGVMSAKNKMTERFGGLRKDAAGHYDRDRLNLISNTASASSAGAAKNQPPAPPSKGGSSSQRDDRASARYRRRTWPRYLTAVSQDAFMSRLGPTGFLSGCAYRRASLVGAGSKGRHESGPVGVSPESRRSGRPRLRWPGWACSRCWRVRRTREGSSIRRQWPP